jgi:N-acetylglutamate synthase-like GNAT family acetyltransferase
MSSGQDAIVYQSVKHLICPTEGFIRIATSADAETLFLFINKTYIKNRSMYEWKFSGNRLNSVDEIHSFMENGIFLLLTASHNEQEKILDDGCSIVACVYIQHLINGKLTKQTVDAKLPVKINMLAVHPSMVKRGIAGYMMQVVDTVAKTFHYTHVYLTVISFYKHLIDMYAKWGFNIIETKTLADSGVNPEHFPTHCHMFVMEKELL